MLWKAFVLLSHTQNNLNTIKGNKPGRSIFLWFKVMGFSNIFHPLDHTPFSLSKRLCVVNDLWQENGPYLCAEMCPQHEWPPWSLCGIGFVEGWPQHMTWLLKSGKEGGHWTLFTRFQFTSPTFYSLVFPSNFFNSVVLSKPHSPSVFSIQFIFSSCGCHNHQLPPSHM